MGDGALPLQHPIPCMGRDSAVGGRAMREFNETPNPLIRFLAQEMGLFSPFKLRWGEETVGNWDFGEELRGTWWWWGG